MFSGHVRRHHSEDSEGLRLKSQNTALKRSGSDLKKRISAPGTDRHGYRFRGRIQRTDPLSSLIDKWQFLLFHVQNLQVWRCFEIFLVPSERKNGADSVSYHLIPGMGHASDPLYSDELLGELDVFMQEKLK